MQYRGLSLGGHAGIARAQPTHDREKMEVLTTIGNALASLVCPTMLVNLHELLLTSGLNEHVNRTSFFGVLLTTWCHSVRLPCRFCGIVETANA